MVRLTIINSLGTVSGLSPEAAAVRSPPTARLQKKTRHAGKNEETEELKSSWNKPVGVSEQRQETKEQGKCEVAASSSVQRRPISWR